MKICRTCKCPREAHNLSHQDYVDVRNRIGLKKGTLFDTKEITLRSGYSWVPPGLTSDQIEEYFSTIPIEKIPRLGAPGEKYRDHQLIKQLPAYDLALAYSKFVETENRPKFHEFVEKRNIFNLDIGYVRPANENNKVCKNCGKDIRSREIIVIAPKLGEDNCWHPPCFVCTVCKELLVDLAYCVKNGCLYCERHFADTVRPRCSGCDELIFSGEYTKAMNKDWHSSHFCCWQCDESLTGQRYVLRDDHPYCVKCYESVFANTCEECNKIIGIDSKDLSYKDKHWHEACFLCNKCRVSLVDKPFGSKAERVYCGDCYDEAFASRCDGCNQPFKAGMKKMEYKGHQWHENCFVCVVCANPIGTRSFIPKDNEIYCTGCYEDKYATRCIKCSQIITSGGVTYRNAPWHRECFTCTECNNCLAGQRFTSRDDKPYCAECFGELFAKRCTSCERPITGIGGTRFICFEDRNWHNDCFNCAECKISLVGKGFITDGPSILCPECAKQKLL
ncbi:four and a half LIM domains protein 2 isoform X2 [Tetranychus urticae]|uniref:four and a half LIM domains protein 2 isoform X2 n=1 Tax=Tetranychus urticae TaxID=32264 RepID=UPI00077BC70F|nr:four and a half LIM domains protein 2 isoform X2 [Tetranychus urticae]